MKIEFADPGSTDTICKVILLDGEEVGHLRKPKWGKGFFVTLDGVTWNNAPGARFTADAGGGAKETYAKTMKQVRERVETHFKNAQNASAD